MSDAAAEPQPGTLIAGKYRVEQVLGRGGMGVVVAARHVQLDQRVAVKLMLPEVLTDGELVARFLREARAAARITSDHVVRVFDVGTLENGAPFMAMECLEGTDLAALVQARGALPPHEVVGYLLEACEAIAEAHAVGVIHRDIKPSNLFLARKRDGSAVVKVLDFGISKLMAGTSGAEIAVTRTAALMGSPLYMSPEQMASSRDVDARSDIWSLGVVLYEALTGKVPFMGETLPQVCVAVMNHDAMPPSERLPSVPRALGDVVLRCLAKRPEQRYATVAELAQALAPFSPGARGSLERIAHAATLPLSDSRAGASGVPGSPNATGQTGAPVSAGAPVPAATHAAWGETRPPRERRRSALAVSGLGAVALAGAGWFVLRPAPALPVEPPAPSTESARALRATEPPSAVAAASGAVGDVPAPAPAAAGSTPVAAPVAEALTASSAALAARAPAQRPAVAHPRLAPKPVSRPEPAAPKPTAQPPKPAPQPSPVPVDLGKPGARSRL